MEYVWFLDSSMQQLRIGLLGNSPLVWNTRHLLYSAGEPSSNGIHRKPCTRSDISFFISRITIGFARKRLELTKCACGRLSAWLILCLPLWITHTVVTRVGYSGEITATVGGWDMHFTPLSAGHRAAPVTTWNALITIQDNVWRHSHRLQAVASCTL